MNQRTRKPMTMHEALPRRDDVDRLYVSRKEGGKWLTSIQDSVDASIQWLEDNIKRRGGRQITAARNNTDNTSINRTKISRKRKWEEKQLYRHFKRQTSEISHEKTWTWLRKENFERNWISSDSRTTPRNKDYVKARRKNIADVDYVMTVTKRSIT